jgi:hypothetical protein
LSADTDPAPTVYRPLPFEISVDTVVGLPYEHLKHLVKAC